MRRIAMVCMCALLVGGCRKELCEGHSTEDNEVDVQITDMLPDVLASFEDMELRSVGINFYPQTGGVITKKIAGSQGKLTLPKGNYSVFVFSSDFYEVDAVFYRGMNNANEAEAYSRVRTEGEELILEEPDPLFCAYVENFSVDAPQELIAAVLRPMVFTYRFRIYVEGIEFLSSASAKVSGMYTSVFLKDASHRQGESASVYVPLRISAVTNTTGYLHGTFRSYGSHQGADIAHRISVALTNGGSTKIVELDDMTGAIKVLPTGGEIEVKQKIVITGQGGNSDEGFNPGVNGWNDIEIPIPM